MNYIINCYYIIVYIYHINYYEIYCFNDYSKDCFYDCFNFVNYQIVYYDIGLFY